MCAFDDIIGTRVIATDADVRNTVLLLQVVESLDEGHFVVRNNLNDCTPSAEQVRVNSLA